VNYYRAIRALAAKDVVSDPPDANYALRRIFRWYSRTFHTPLDRVSDLPLYDVLVAYYEASYEAMEPEELKKELTNLAMTDAELAAQQSRETDHSAEDEAFLAEVAREEMERAAAAAKAVQEPAQPDVKMTFMDIEELDRLAETDGFGGEPLVGLD